MDLTQLANLEEFIGGVAVIGSLIFVGLQIRQGNSTDSLSASLGLQSSHNEMVQFLCADSDVFLEALGAFNDLPGTRRLEIASKLYHLYSHSELVFQQQRKGLVTADTANRHFGWLFWVHSWPGPREWWNVGPVIKGRSLVANREIFSSEFVRFVDEASPFPPPPQGTGVLD